MVSPGRASQGSLLPADDEPHTDSRSFRLALQAIACSDGCADSSTFSRSFVLKYWYHEGTKQLSSLGRASSTSCHLYLHVYGDGLFPFYQGGKPHKGALN